MRARFPSVLLVLWLGAAAVPAHAAIRAWLDQSRVGEGNSVQLTLEYDGITTSEPDLSPLHRNFDVLGTSTSTSIQIGTGGSSETTEVVLTLSPKRTGRLTIPSIAWDGEYSAPLSLTVTGAGAAPPANGSAAAARAGRVFIRTSVKPKHPYVQQAVQVAVRIYTSEQLYHGSLDFSGSGAALVRKMGADTYGSVVRDGHPYQVITRRYVLFPMQSGRLSLPGPVLEAEVAARSQSSWNPFGNFFGGLVQTTRPIRVYGDPLALSVRRRPAGARGSYWLPAENVTLTARWNPGRQGQVGDPLAVELDLQAVGLTAAQLPNLSSLLRLPAGLTAYPDQAKLYNTTQGSLIVGSRDQTIALIADRPGLYTLQGLRVRWWDTQTNQPRVATLPLQRLTVLPAHGGMTAQGGMTARGAPSAAHASKVPPVLAGAPSSVPSPAGAARSAPEGKAAPLSPWAWISGGLAALWVATLGGWLWSQRRLRARKPRSAPAPSARQPTPADPSKAQAAFRAACANDDAAGARRHLLAWAQAVWGAPPAGLNALAAALGQSGAAELVRELDRACYGGGEWHGQPLAAVLTELPPRDHKPRRDRGLAPLYP